MHGASRTSGSDVPQHLGFIRDQMAQAGGLPWIALGDYNREPDSLRNAVGPQFTVHAPAEPTRPTPLVSTSTGPSTIDYAVAPTAQGQPTVTDQRRVNLTTSDHYPVVLTLTDLPAAPPPAQQQPAPTVPAGAVLQSAATTNVAGPSGSSHVVGDQPVNRADLPSQTFSLSADPEYPGYYRLFHATAPFAGRYLGQEGDARDARTVLWPNPAVDQLWAPVDQGDGTWTLQNYHTRQFLTDLGRGQNLAGRDYDGSAAQRWFLQAPSQVANLDEIISTDGGTQSSALSVDDRDPVPQSVFLSPNTHRGTQRFGVIPAGRSGGELCYYLVNGGQYVNSTAARPGQPQANSVVTMGDFRPNDDGYLWCVTPDGGSGTLLTNHTSPTERLNLTRSPASDDTELSSPSSTAAKLHWIFNPATQ
ncbi:RICIN domain-containing protein [Kitasatospora sp. NPDC094019]|uniref:RICIN domain-containing protein n=1 Tax=Kitasatospora sp. NPDC094019 TaxID=3364091 RepID=UPI00380E5EDA